MDKTQAIKMMDLYCGRFESVPNRLKVIKFRRLKSGGWVFGVFVAYQGEVKEVTNFFAIAYDKPLKEKVDNWETRGNPGYDLEDWVNELNNAR